MLGAPRISPIYPRRIIICASSKKYQRRDGRGAYDMRLECKKYAPRITFSVVVLLIPCNMVFWFIPSEATK